jgi:hypothetical protein
MRMRRGNARSTRGMTTRSVLDLALGLGATSLSARNADERATTLESPRRNLDPLDATACVGL